MLKTSSTRSPEVGIFGSYPPPYGGMSVHVLRLAALLDEFDVSYRVYNGVGEFADPPRIVNARHNASRTAVRELLAPKHELYYVLTTRTMVRAWAGLLGSRGKKVVLRVGGQSLEWALRSSRWRERVLSRFALRHIWGVVAVSDRIAELATEVRGHPERIWSIPGFLRPSKDEQETSLSPHVQKFLQEHSPLLLAMGRFDKLNGKEVYGVGTLIELLHRLRGSYPRAGVLFALTAHGDVSNPVGVELRKRIDQLGLGRDFLIHPAEGPLVAIMPQSDLLVRPTTTDGDSNAVREALWLSLPVVASDCVERPSAATVFATDSLEDCEAKVRGVLADMDGSRARVAGQRPTDNWPVLRDMLGQALGRSIAN